MSGDIADKLMDEGCRVSLELQFQGMMDAMFEGHPPPVTHPQYIDMRRAFYGGALVTLEITANAVFQEQDAKAFHMLQQQVQQFSQDLSEGKG